MIKIAISILVLLNFSSTISAADTTKTVLGIEESPNISKSFYQQSVDKLFTTGSQVISHFKKNRNIYTTIAAAGIVAYYCVQPVNGNSIGNQNLSTACPFNFNLCFTNITVCDNPCVYTAPLKDFYYSTCTRLMEVTSATFKYDVGDWKNYITGLYYTNNCQSLGAGNDHIIRLSGYPKVVEHHAICQYQIFRTINGNENFIGTLTAKMSKCLGIFTSIDGNTLR